MEVVILVMTYLQKHVPNKTKCVYVKVFNMTMRINEAKSSIKHSCNCKCKFNSTTYNSN